MSFLNQVANLVLVRATARTIAFAVVFAVVFVVGYLIEHRRRS